MGYDGGPFFSFDGAEIVWRANRPKTEEEQAKYRLLRDHNEFSPTTLDLYVMNADGTNVRRVTDNGAANFGPFFHPDGKRIIFSSNIGPARAGRACRTSTSTLVNTDGTGPHPDHHLPVFNRFPMFSADGKRLVFCSNRDNGGTADTNVFLADFR